MVTDAQVIQHYYLAQHNAKSTMIAYGSEVDVDQIGHSVRKWRVDRIATSFMCRGST